MTNACRSFYNSPEYAEIAPRLGSKIRLVETKNGVGFPYAVPIDWVPIWRNLRAPIPAWARSHSSGYLGITADYVPSPLQFREAIEELELIVGSQSRWARRGSPIYRFMQPPLLTTGVMPDIDAIASESNEFSTAHDRTPVVLMTRIKELPETADPVTEDFLGFPVLRDAPVGTEIYESYQSPRRYDIRKALGNALTVESHIDGDTASRVSRYREIRDVHVASWTRTGLQPHTIAYFTDFSEAVIQSGGHEILTIVRDVDGNILSFVIVHVMGKSALYSMNSSAPLGLKLGANPLALHFAQTAACLIGVQWFEFGRFPIDESGKAATVTKYKAEFGGALYPVPAFAI